MGTTPILGTILITLLWGKPKETDRRGKLEPIKSVIHLRVYFRRSGIGGYGFQ